MDVEERRRRAQVALDEAGARTVQLAAYVDYLARFGAEDEPLEYEAWADEFGAAALDSYRLSLVREETYRGIMRRLGRLAPSDEEVAETALASIPEWFFRSFSEGEE
ncbi:MAG TPA: hypothetical protein VFW96_21060 [Thermomicrobiales bacterium]|nr:hypothetical protein [Thermomicrobiales bacterium]